MVSTPSVPSKKSEYCWRRCPAPIRRPLRRSRARDRRLTKPPGALGRLEEIVEWLAAWQGRAAPAIERPLVAVFAANHGVVAQGVSAFPASVTQQMVANFLAGGAAINQICKSLWGRPESL